MLGFLYRCKLVASLVVFLLTLTFLVVVRPFRSVLLSLLLLVWFLGCFAVGVSNTPTALADNTKPTPLFSLLFDDFSNAGFQAQRVQLIDLKHRQQAWEARSNELFNSRDFLLNGALLYKSLGHTETAQSLFEKAQQTDPNHLLFKIQMDQFFN